MSLLEEVCAFGASKQFFIRVIIAEQVSLIVIYRTTARGTAAQVVAKRAKERLVARFAIALEVTSMGLIAIPVTFGVSCSCWNSSLKTWIPTIH